MSIARVLRAASALLVSAMALAAAEIAMAQGTGGSALTSPAEGASLQGQVSVTGTTAMPGFSSAELAFAYATDATGSWFVIQTASLPVESAEIGVWDTTAITDGEYILRLRVVLQDGSHQDSTVRVTVANYTATPTPVPVFTPTEPPSVQIPTPMLLQPSETASPAPPPPALTPTPLPSNPAGISVIDIYTGFWRGAVWVAVIVLIAGLIIRFRRY